MLGTKPNAGAPVSARSNRGPPVAQFFSISSNGSGPCYEPVTIPPTHRSKLAEDKRGVRGEVVFFFRRRFRLQRAPKDPNRKAASFHHQIERGWLGGEGTVQVPW